MNIISAFVKKRSTHIMNIGNRLKCVYHYLTNQFADFAHSILCPKKVV